MNPIYFFSSSVGMNPIYFFSFSVGMNPIYFFSSSVGMRNESRKCTSEKGTNALFVLREGME